MIVSHIPNICDSRAPTPTGCDIIDACHSRHQFFHAKVASIRRPQISRCARASQSMPCRASEESSGRPMNNSSQAEPLFAVHMHASSPHAATPPPPLRSSSSVTRPQRRRDTSRRQARPLLASALLFSSRSDVRRGWRCRRAARPVGRPGRCLRPPTSRLGGLAAPLVSSPEAGPQTSQRFRVNRGKD